MVIKLNLFYTYNSTEQYSGVTSVILKILDPSLFKAQNSNNSLNTTYLTYYRNNLNTSNSSSNSDEPTPAVKGVTKT